ncbi:succinyl-diaminopimelate desuccinylase [Geothrix rubra]|uniref:Succinyl-diaminopimelate desuccinylase n=1 Tax=Geothrix rubra TaxID=2927977 RepID=A0ABQ5Q927_9BACT|nr:M20 family metallopeptidase [Geothrix rubra]GLH71117.1 succinyl-diaminopimelate desuccinylase [Geothrix rubra]
MNTDAARRQIDQQWDTDIIPTLERYIEIPNQSPDYDPEWRTNGLLQQAVELARAWVEKQHLPGSRLEVLTAEGRTPMLLLEVEGDGEDTVLLYGHLDKQPPTEGWEEGLGAYQPVIRDGKLYGRGGADDGYALFATVSAIQALQAQGVKHSRLVTLIECCEESGSGDLEYYVDLLAPRIGTPGLVICLDSGCGNYEQLWSTASLRGVVMGNLTVQVLTEGVHSGDASGIVPSSFRIARQLLNRLEDPDTGELLPEWLKVEIPSYRVEEARRTAQILGDTIHTSFPFVPGMRPVTSDLTELMLNRTWRSTLSVTGQAGMPDVEHAGNVLRPRTSLKLSVRLPPTLIAEDVVPRLKALLEENPPYGARVTFDGVDGASGWDAPELAPWLRATVDEASRAFFGREACYMGEGGSIPFMGMLGERFPEAQFLITGVLGPQSNAHGPNEFLHIQTAKHLTGCVAYVLERYHAERKG